ncbi:helix-turn-helix domain-containing protein [Phragmitibacter flavus]|uniref:Helix-turn-helix domain-containing protein n=1 Tax=Phragmitibacter flavus TaxID=2576071 RepID=A0A5R8KK70_9BACT|nr:AraC family transcriptional regulator [Phragmitibacter flavus]TLD72692.1 helix-turn-helix domain-containing protein [Phragmitibacter flavus]
MSPKQQLIHFLGQQPHEVFKLSGRIDSRRYLPRTFPSELPLILSLQQYPGYQRMVGENWLHWHDYFEFFVALSGNGHFRSGHDLFHFHPGDIVVVDPLKIHGVWEMDAKHTALVVLFPRHLVASDTSGTSLDEAYLAPWEQRSGGRLPLIQHDDPAAANVHSALLAFAQTWFNPSPASDRSLQLKLELLTVLFHLRQAFPLEPSSSVPTADRALQTERLRRALDYLSQHAHEPLTQFDVAKAVGMSTSRFRAFFKATTGWGFAQFVREQRVERAAKLLRESSDSVATIAHLTGFADQSHLLRCFKAKHEVSPLTYRHRHQG